MLPEPEVSDQEESQVSVATVWRLTREVDEPAKVVPIAGREALLRDLHFLDEF